MSVWQALPNVTKLSSPIQADSQPASRYMSQLIMPANPHRLCSALKPGHIYDSAISQQTKLPPLRFMFGY